MAAEPENGEPVADAPLEPSVHPLADASEDRWRRRVASVVVPGRDRHRRARDRPLRARSRCGRWSSTRSRSSGACSGITRRAGSPFLILLLVLVFWQAGLYKPRETREAAGRVVPSVILVAALSLAFAVGTGQHFTTFGLYVAAAASSSRPDRRLPRQLRAADGHPAARGRRASQGAWSSARRRSARACARRSARAAAASTTTSSRECELGPELERALATRVARRDRGRRRRLDERGCSRSSKPRIAAASRYASRRARPSC